MIVIAGVGAISPVRLHEFLARRESPLVRFVQEGSNVIKNGDAWCKMDGVPSQCGMVVLYDFAFQNDGKMRDILDAGQQIAAWCNYTYMQITLTANQRIRAAEEFGFREVLNFVNRRTQNVVHVLVKEVAH